jgi:uncharacterized Tic20 family protein
MDEANERAWAVLCHLGVIAGGLVPAGHILVPGAIWLWYRGRSKLIDENGRESLNFQLTLTVYAVLAIVLVMGLPKRLKGAGYAVWLAIFIFGLVNVIRAAMATYNRKEFRYPLALRPIPPAS